MIKVFIATHKDYDFPEDIGYQPIQVGAEINTHLGEVLKDNLGDNISWKNKNYCELTALYWIWKNCKDDYVGLVHYRRHFKASATSGRSNNIKGTDVISSQDLNEIINDVDVILPCKISFSTGSLIREYSHYHYMRDLVSTRESIQFLFPDYVESFDWIMQSSSASMFNMFVGKKDIIDRYCSWLFSVLSDLESKVNIVGYDRYQQRIFGFLAERLFNVWIYHNRSTLKIKYLPVVETESTNRPNFSKFSHAKILFSNYVYYVRRIFWRLIYGSVVS